MRIRDIWSWVKRQPASYWFLTFYMFFEYVRPQQIYQQIDVLPFAWSCIWLAVACFAVEGFRVRKPYGADVMLALFAVMILISSFLADLPEESFKWFSLFFSWVLVYALITNIVNTSDRFLIFMLAFLLYSTKMSQHGFRGFVERGGSFSSWGASGAPGWFQNSGEFGIQMCIFFPLSAYFIQALKPFWSKRKMWLFLFMPVSAVVSIVASSSRGAIVGLIPVVLWMLVKSRKRLKAVVLTVIVMATIYTLLPPEQKDRFNSMGDDATSQSRLTYWKYGIDMMEKHPVTGVGYRNWLPHMYANYPPWVNPDGGWGQYQLPHNIFIEAGAELGFTGLFLFVGLIGATFYTNYKTRKLAKRRPDGGGFIVLMSHGLDAGLVGFLFSGFFVTVLYYPFFWINYAMTVALHNVAQSEGANTTASAAVGRLPMRHRHAQ